MKPRPPLLERILNLTRQAKLENRQLKAIFDLDSTLFNVSPRIIKILHDFANLPSIKNDFPKASEKLLTLEPHLSDFGVKRTLTRIGFETPNQEFIIKIVDYWKKEFFGSDHLHLDVPYPGAQKFVKDLYDAGAEILYLTGRDVPRMLKGTMQSLKLHGFPVDADHANLLLKPSTSHNDSEFKKEFFKKLDQSSKDIWFFENEPTNIHLVYENCPHINIVFVNTVHSGKSPEPGAHILQIPGFEI
jgi:FMN phosphatase YigB (HAD superfamily)